jgi:hypothetical protein
MRRFAFCLLVFLFVSSFAIAEKKRDPLNNQEIDELREVAQEPNKRLALLIKYMKARMLAIQQLQADPKIADRNQQIHDLLDDFNYLHDEFDDNLDMYTRQAADFRKALKSAVEAYSDWQLRLRTLKDTSKPDEAKQFGFVLETALENVNAGADETRELLAEQEREKKGKKEKKDPLTQKE